MSDWTRCDDILPPIGQVVDTIVDDGDGERNHQHLKRGGANGNLWFFPQGDMYVYYAPTHWRPAE